MSLDLGQQKTAPLVLRDYQVKAWDLLRQKYADGGRKIAFCGATSFGKTALMSAMFESAISKGSRCAFLTNRITLVNQSSRVFFGQGLDPSIIWAGNPEAFDPSKQLQVCSTETLRARLKKPAYRETIGKFQFVFIDEFHLTVSKAYKAMIDSLCEPNTALIGLSATPWAKGAGEIYSDGIVSSIYPDELLEQGYLSPCRIVRGTCKIDLDKLPIDPKTNDYRAAEAGQAVMKGEVYDDIVKTYRAYCHNKRAIVFAAGQQHAKTLLVEFQNAGYPSAIVIAQTPPEERELHFNRTRTGENLILISVDALSEGLDIVEVEAVLLCAPTRSLVKYIQRTGRGARLSQHTDKQFYWLLDFVGCTMMHGSPYDRRKYAFPDAANVVKPVAPPKEKEPWTCGSCKVAINTYNATHCHLCGVERPKPPPITLINLGLAMTEVAIKTRREVLRTATKPQIQAILGALKWFCNEMGWKEAKAKFMWFNFFGEFPSDKDFAVAPAKWHKDADPIVTFDNKQTTQHMRNKGLRMHYAKKDHHG